MVLHAREFKKKDIPEINKIFKRQPDLGIPSLKNTIMNCTFVNETKDGDKVVGYGVLRNNAMVTNFPEATLIIDKNARNIDKGRAIKEGIDIGIKACKKAGLDTLFIIVDDSRYPSYTRILQEHFNAQVCPGTLLMIEVGE